VVVAQQHLLSHLNGASCDAADADSAHVLIIVNGGDQHLQRCLRIALRRIHIGHNGVEQGFEVGACFVGVKAGRAGTAGAVQERGVFQLFLAGIQIHEQLQHLVCDLVQACVRTVDLVDHNDDLQVHFQCLGEHKACLRHRALSRIYQQQCAVYHAENTFYLAAEVRMSRCINDIDFGVAVAYRGVLCQNGDTTLTLQIVGVHDTVCHSLIFPEYAALLQHLVNQRGLAVVNVGDNGDISQIFSYHNSLPLSRVRRLKKQHPQDTASDFWIYKAIHMKSKKNR